MSKLTRHDVSEFLQTRPRMLEKYNFQSGFDTYIKELTRNLPRTRDPSRFDEYILHEVNRILAGLIDIDKLKCQIQSYRFLSSADHHGLLNYKLLYNSNILLGELVKHLKLPYIIVLSTGNITLKNISYPRGFYFKKQKFNFFPKNKSQIPVYLAKLALCDVNKNGLESFIKNFFDSGLSFEERRFLEYLFCDCLEIEKALVSYEKFSDQITFLNYRIWKYYFDNGMKDQCSEMIYLQSNYIFKAYIIDELKKSDSLISRILFDEKIRELYIKNFDGIPCCWGSSYGSHFFWGISEKERSISLQYNAHSKSLVGENFILKMEKDEIIDKLSNEKILPTTFFDFLIKVFLEGYLALGGFNQIEYLPLMQQAHVRSLKEIGEYELADVFASRVTDGLICGLMPFSFDSGLDLMWHYNSKDGRFNGNLDRGLGQKELDQMLNTKVSDLIAAGIETMMKITDKG